MSLEQLLKASLPAKIEESKPVSPTLFIGIGGTGKEVLLRLRRLVVERYGSLAALPFMQFVHMDTDTTAAAKEQYDLRGGDDPLHDEVQFKPSERIDLTIDGGTGKYVEHINAYPHIKRWFPTSGKIADLGNLGKGAGQIRLASRLGFYHAPNFSKIGSRLEQVRGRLRDPAILHTVGDLGFEFDAQGMNIFAVCSIAGGTGGGVFLDMGFLLQRYFPDAERVGILMLPSFFRDYAGGTRVRANGYAALVELNHYSFGNLFHANWDGTTPLAIQPPPFTTTYLVDGLNEAGLVIGSSGKEYDAYQMVSEILFQDYSMGAFAGMKRATRVNLVNFNLNVYTHNFLNAALHTGDHGNNKTVVGETYPTRFGSFGLATIYFPSDRLHSACGARLATDVLEFWQKTLLEDPLEQLFFKFLSHSDVNFAQGEFERRDGGGRLERTDVLEALSVYEAGGGKTFPSYLWEKAQTIRSELEATPVKQKAAALDQRLAELDKFLAYEDSEDPDEWGVGIRQLESNMRNYLDRVKSGIEKRAEQMANDDKLGVAYTLSLLREMKKTLKSEGFWYLPYFETEITTWRDEIQEHSYALDQIKLDIARHERQLLFRNDDLNRDMEMLVGGEDGDNPGALYSYYYSRVMKQVAKRGKRICEEIDAFLGKDDVTGKGLLGRYYNLLAGFERLKDRLRAKARYFIRAHKSELLVSLYREEDAETWYRRWMGTEEQEKTTLKTVGNQLLQKVFKVENVTAALAYIQQTPVDEIESRLMAECKKHFSSQDEQPNALDMLLSDGRFSTKQQEEMVKRAYSLAKVWLKRAETGLEHTGLPPVRADQRPCLIGVDTASAPRLAELKKVVRDIQSADDSAPSFLNIGEANRGTIIFYNELAGVPAFYPGAVTQPNGLAAAYRGYQDKEELHIDKNRFQFGDLIPKTTEEARNYANSLKAFVLARLLGLLKVREFSSNGEQPHFYYSYKREVGFSTKEDVQLGDELHAVDALFRDRREEHLTDRQLLLNQVEDTIQMMRVQKLLWAYALLVDFYLYKVYPPTRDENYIANITIIKYSPEYAVLDLARREIQKLVPAEEERVQLKNALESKRRSKDGEEMSYEEYLEALEPYVKEAGKFAIQKTSAVGVERTEYRLVPALDLEKLGGKERDIPKPPKPKVAQPATPREKAPERPCPNCGGMIDARALYCRHCQQTIAEHVTCPHCGEQRVPDDLEHCWRCGNKIRDVEKIDCPQCYSFSGYESDFPCPVCGYDLRAGAPEAKETAVPEQESESAEAVPDEGSAPSTESTGATPPPPPPERGADSDDTNQVECPTCFSMVPAGPKCPVCGGLLESR